MSVVRGADHVIASICDALKQKVRGKKWQFLFIQTNSNQQNTDVISLVTPGDIKMSLS